MKKLLIASMLFIAGLAFAQQPAPNIILQNVQGKCCISITLPNGQTFSNAPVMREDTDGIVLGTPTGGVKVTFVSMGQKLLADFQAARENYLAKNKTSADAKNITGYVLQVLPQGGLVVLCEKPSASKPSTMQRFGGGGYSSSSSDDSRVYGTFIVTGHPQEKKFADGDKVAVKAVEKGVRQLHVASGSPETYHVYQVVAQ